MFAPFGSGMLFLSYGDFRRFKDPVVEYRNKKEKRNKRSKPLLSIWRLLRQSFRQ